MSYGMRVGKWLIIAELIKGHCSNSRSVCWYTALVSKASNLSKIISYLNNEKPGDYNIISNSFYLSNT